MKATLVSLHWPTVLRAQGKKLQQDNRGGRGKNEVENRL